MNNTHVLVVNINNLGFTKDCVEDLLKQDTTFNLTLIDQNSYESGTKEYFLKIKKNWDFSKANLKIIFNNENKDLNRIWDEFYKNTNEKFLCFLNNDVRIPSNFISDNEKIFEKEVKVGCVCHATNHLKYNKKLKELKYEISKINIMQGWDFTMRREAYTIIPNELRIYCGDAFLFKKLYENNWDCAFALSSPIIHYRSKSAKFVTVPTGDKDRYINKLGFKDDLRIHKLYSVHKPTFKKILE